MKNTKFFLKNSLLVGTALGFSQIDANAENMFSFTELGNASYVRTALSSNSPIVGLDLGCGSKTKDAKSKSSDAKCGEGKCGEGKCGKKSKMKDHKCGKDCSMDAKKKKDKVGKMKDHKCGKDCSMDAKKKKDKEGKSKDHKCGENTCGGSL